MRKKPIAMPKKPHIASDGKRLIKFGPLSALGMRKVLFAYRGQDSEITIAEDLLAYFEIKGEKAKEIDYKELTAEEKIALNIDPNIQQVQWKLGFTENTWTKSLSRSEWSTLRSAFLRYRDFSAEDTWRKAIWNQIEIVDPGTNPTTKDPAPPPPDGNLQD